MAQDRGQDGMSADEYVEAVLDLVERIPPGRVMSYGAIADALADRSGRRSPRRVGTIMARYGGAVPWHRVVAADGRLSCEHQERARRRHAAEGTPMRGDRVDMPAAAWYPDLAGDGQGGGAAGPGSSGRPGGAGPGSPGRTRPVS